MDRPTVEAQVTFRELEAEAKARGCRIVTTQFLADIQRGQSERRPRGYSRVVWRLRRWHLLHRVAFRKPSPDCHPPALNWFGRLLARCDYRLDYDGLRDAR